MPTNISQFDWNRFWKHIPEDAKSIEQLIFRQDNGQWVTVFVIPNSFEVLAVQVKYNPFTGEKLN